MEKKNFSPFKMKFSIQEEGGEKQIFFTFKEASEKTGISSKTILRVLKSGKNKYFRRVDKKTFWIQDESQTPFIQIDGEDFFTAEEIQERFGLSRTVFLNQLRKKKTHFLDSQEKSHEVTWKSLILEKLIDLMQRNEIGQKIIKKTSQQHLKTTIKKISNNCNQNLEEIQDQC